MFPRALAPGYPPRRWRLRRGGDGDLSEPIRHRLLENAANLARDDLAKVRTAANEANVTVVKGINDTRRYGRLDHPAREKK